MNKPTGKNKTLRKTSGALSSKTRVIAIVVGFAVVGGILVYRSFAAVIPPNFRSKMLGFKTLNVANGGIKGFGQTSIVTDPLTKAQVIRVPAGSYVTTEGAKEMPSAGIFCFSVRAEKPIAKVRRSIYPINGVGITATAKEKVTSSKPSSELSVGQIDVNQFRIDSSATAAVTTKWTSTCTNYVRSSSLGKPGNISVISGTIRNYNSEPIFVRQAIQDVPTY